MVRMATIHFIGQNDSIRAYWSRNTSAKLDKWHHVCIVLGGEWFDFRKQERTHVHFGRQTNRHFSASCAGNVEGLILGIRTCV